MAGVYREKGEVKALRQSEDGKFVHVTIAHGKRKPKPKATKGNAVPYHYDDRRTTEYAIPVDQADEYVVGSKVMLTIRCIKSKAARKQSADEAVDEMYGGKAL